MGSKTLTPTPRSHSTIPQSLHLQAQTLLVPVAPRILGSVGWRKDYTKSGRPFYRHDHEQVDTWDKPTEASAVPESTRSGSSSGSGSGRDNNRPAKTTQSVSKRSSASPLPAGARLKILHVFRAMFFRAIRSAYVRQVSSRCLWNIYGYFSG